jgi:chemotaxis protein methyltransferase CheR
MPIGGSDFDYICSLIREKTAIILDPGKEYLVDVRLSMLAACEGFESVENLISGLRKNSFNALHQKVVEAMTVNETSFFRDIETCHALKERVLPELMAKRSKQRQLNLWSAACSSGQEPYSLAMLIREHFQELDGWAVQFIASDISTGMLKKAEAGIYNKIEVNRGLPVNFLLKYFQKRGDQWHIREDLRRMIRFQKINLAESLTGMPPMDIILMKNVMIYFDKQMKKRILDHLHHILKPDGYLFLGVAESTVDFSSAFERVQWDQACCFRRVA